MAAPSDIITQYFRPGVVLKDRYQIEKLIGAGAYSAIFSAIDSQTGQRVAVKAIPPLLDGGRKTSIGRFQREMRIIGNLRHDNIIAFYDFGETEELIGFMIIEYIEGRTLLDVIDRNPMPPLTAIDVTRQIASALQAAHQQGVVHRDLKPQNVMLIRKDANHYLVKVLDFGMAKLTKNAGEEPIAELTREGIAVGTPRYIAPEQARGKTVGPYTDLYALGLLMYEMFTGERAVKADSIESAIRAHVSSKPHNFQEIDQVPEALRDILFTLTAKRVAERYQEADHVISALNKVEPLFDPTLQEELFRIENEPTVAYDPDKRKTRRESATGMTHDDPSLAPTLLREPVPQAHIAKRRRTIQEEQTRTAGFSFFFLLLLTPIMFISISAQFPERNYFLRLFIGFLPLLFAAIPSLVSAVTKREPSIPFTRLAVGFSLVAIVSAHLIAPNSFSSGLWNDASWFLKPFSAIPGIESLSKIVDMISRQYVSFLMSISDSFSPRSF